MASKKAAGKINVTRYREKFLGATWVCPGATSSVSPGSSSCPFPQGALRSCPGACAPRSCLPGWPV